MLPSQGAVVVGREQLFAAREKVQSGRAHFMHHENIGTDINLKI